MLLITAVVMLQGSGVAGGASFIGIMAEQIVIALLCGVGADPNTHTATPVLYEGTFYRDTAIIRIRAGIAGIISKYSAVLEGVVTPCGTSLVKVLALFILVGR